MNDKYNVSVEENHKLLSKLESRKHICLTDIANLSSSLFTRLEIQKLVEEKESENIAKGLQLESLGAELRNTKNLVQIEVHIRAGCELRHCID